MLSAVRRGHAGAGVGYRWLSRARNDEEERVARDLSCRCTPHRGDILVPPYAIAACGFGCRDSASTIRAANTQSAPAMKNAGR